MPARVKVADILKPIDEVKTQAYFGRHLHTLGLIKWILSQIGPADVWVSSYSTSEEFLRGFRLMRDSGSISSAKMLLDVKANKKTVHLWRLMSACFDDVYLGENHSKVTLFRNDQHVVSVVTSQNQTYGSRDESTIITTEPQVFADLFNGYTSHCDNQSLRINGNYSGVTQQSARAAENLTPISEMSVLLDIKEDVLREEILDPASELRRVYYLGMAKVRQQIRRNELELAAAGSPQAVQRTHEYLNKMIEEIKI